MRLPIILSLFEYILLIYIYVKRISGISTSKLRRDTLRRGEKDAKRKNNTFVAGDAGDAGGDASGLWRVGI